MSATKMNFSTNGSEHAFPHLHLEGGKIDLKGGLTKREYFAAMAMQGLIGSGFATDCRQNSALATDHADTLLAELEKKSSNPPGETL